MKTANLAIVFTDIKGFTERTSRQTLEQNERLLEAHTRLLKPLFESFGGRIIKSIGDAFMVTFESPTQAVLCGAAIQDRLWIHNRTAPEEVRFEVRVAVNVGEVRVENNDIFGEPVNIAARVEGIAEAGEVYFTESVYLSMNKADVPSEEVGSFELKGIPGRIKLFRVPHAPYRMQAPQTAPSTEEALPPFGNIGLSKVKDEPAVKVAEAQMKAAVSSLVETTRGVMEKARDAEVGQKAKGLISRLNARVVGGVAVGLLIVAALLIALTSSEVKSAIDDVASAPERDRRQRVERAEKLIRALKDPSDRAWYYGQLYEAQGDMGGAVDQYGSGAKLGSSRAERRLVNLLEHDKCSVRSAAASRIASIKLTSAKGDLEDLAEDGGPDDDDGQGGIIGAFLGCNSKEAAARALKQLQ